MPIIAPRQAQEAGMHSTTETRREEALMVLVVGATGLVGGEAARLLSAKGVEVRGLARSTSDPA